ncbi:MAG: hypothetical protein OXH20_06240 [bacterium]|nr:hypothetical protein [bacterium]MYB24941.1 hypothetical protein [Acidimicrobiia bacterium]
MTTPAASPPPHVELSAVMRLEADYLPPGARAKLLRLADELEEKGDPALVSPAILRAALKADAADEDQ